MQTACCCLPLIRVGLPSMPDNPPSVKDQYSDSTIIGFAHTNFSGTGHSYLGDFLVMPTTGDLVLDPLKTESGSKGFYSLFFSRLFKTRNHAGRQSLNIAVAIKINN